MPARTGNSAGARPESRRNAGCTEPAAVSGGKMWTAMMPTSASPRARSTPADRVPSPSRAMRGPYDVRPGGEPRSGSCLSGERAPQLVDGTPERLEFTVVGHDLVGD